jgi:penicillin-binding protein-related factor A (putative recombinase)
MGIKAKAFGDLFESLFVLGCRRTNGLVVTRFPDGCKVVGRNQVIRVKTPCDWIITFGGVTALIDTKTTEGESFPFSKIEKHQVSEMLRHELAGAKAGYVIWFRKTDDVLFVSASLLASLMLQRGSIKPKGYSAHLGNSRDFKAQIIFGTTQ